MDPSDLYSTETKGLHTVDILLGVSNLDSGWRTVTSPSTPKAG
jgi:hypothetical protein